MDSGKLQNADEALIVGLARTGDRTAFAELVRRRQSWLRNLFRRLGADPSLADDLAQQAFLLAFKNINKIQEPRKFPGWLKTTALNVWRMHWRQQSPEVSLPTAAATDQAQEDTEPGLNHDLQRALGTLSSETRACIVLAYHEGMSHPEIAQALDLPLGTVKSHISRGSKKLRTELGDYVSNPN